MQSCVLLKMDNVAAVRYMNRLGGTRSRALSNMARDLWEYCLSNNISIGGALSGDFQPSGGLVLAPLEGHQPLATTPGSVQRTPVLLGSFLGGPLCIPPGCSVEQILQLAAGSGGPGSGCLPSGLEQGGGIRFSPLCDDHEGLNPCETSESRLGGDHADMEIASLVSGSDELSWDFLVRLPHGRKLLRDPQGNPHHLLIAGSLNLMAWRVSGDAGKSQAFRHTLPRYCENPGRRAPIRNTDLHGPDGAVGVFDGKWIRWGRTLSMSLIS